MKNRRPHRNHFYLTLSLVITTTLLLVLFVTQSPPTLADSTPQLSSSDWSTYLANVGRNSFNTQETAITAASASRLKEHWTARSKGLVSAQPVEANNHVYWGSWDGMEYATDLNGRTIWATYLGKTFTCGSSAGVASTATVASLTIKGRATSVVLVGGGDGRFYALDALNGRVLWKTLLGAPPSNFIWSSPAVYQGHIYIGVASFGDCPSVQGKMVELNATTGVIEHSFSVVPNGCIGGSVWSSPAIDAAADTIYITTGNNDRCATTERLAYSIIKLRASDLKLLDFWQLPRSERGFDSDFGATPTLFTATIGGVTRTLVGVANKNGIYYALLRDGFNRAPVWRTRIAYGGIAPDLGDGSISPSGWDGKRLYIGGGKTFVNGRYCRGSVRAVNPANGAFFWEMCVSSGPVVAPVTIVPGVAIVEGGNTLALVSTSTGRTLFSYKTNSIFNGGSSISRGVLYVGSYDGKLHALGL